MALAAISFLLDNAGLTYDTSVLLNDLRDAVAFMNALYQKIEQENQTIILDCAHNLMGLDALILRLKQDILIRHLHFYLWIKQKMDRQLTAL